MRNFDVGRLLGIPIKVNVSLLLFLPVLAWLIAATGQIETYVGFINALSGQGLDAGALTAGSTPWVIGITGALGLFVSVLLHELGHSWMAQRYDIEIVSITLWIFGGMARMAEIPEEWNKELWIALAGPAVSLLLGIGGVAALAVLPAATPVLTFIVGFLGVVNLSLVVFNLLPAFPMDGGRVLRALLASQRPYAEATQTAATVGKGMAVLMGLTGLGLFGSFSPMLVLIALFIYMAAGSESKATVVRELLRGVVVADMMSDAETVTADATVAEVVERFTLQRVYGFPVVEGREVVGVVTLDDVRDVAPGERGTTTVREVMRADPATVAPGEDAFSALQLLGERGGPLLVTEDNRFRGLVTEADIVRTMEVIEGLGTVGDRDLAPEGYA